MPKMISRRNSRRAWGLFAGLALAAVACADEPREWLKRMNEALVSRNYDGVFSHWQNGRVEMLRIIHRIQDGEVNERLVSLDGSGREFIRSGSELACYLPDKRTVVVEKGVDRSPLLGNLPSFDETSAGVYDIQQIKRTRFNRRNTRVIAVTPRDEFRYGYRLWIDESTALPVQTQLFDARGRVVEQVVFSDLRVKEHIANADFKPEVDTEGFQWVRNERGPERTRVSQPVVLSALKLPPGFRMTNRSAQLLPGASAPVSHLVFTDGLASVSVFVETQTTRAVPNGQAAAAPASQTFGASSTFSTVVNGSKVVVVGEVPPATVRFIANSLNGASAAPSEAPQR
jgi:sigma-E factor negative regulatory protein RseB